jgi:hypothetical protein
MWKRSTVIAALIAAVLGNLAGARAGTTGNINGVVLSAAGPPVAGTRILAISPSQSASTVTDGAGHFTLLSLAPDTYAITASKDYRTPSTPTSA